MVEDRDEDKRVPDTEFAEDIDYQSEDDLGQGAAAKAKLQKLRDELEEIRKERQQYLDGWQRCKADSINLRKDSEREIARMRQIGTERLAEALIPALDSFDMAIVSESWNSVAETWRKGVESIKNQFTSALESEGVFAFGEKGERYDPAIHEIVQEIDGDGESGEIARVVRRGWKTGERIIRAAHVIIYKIGG